MGSLSGNNFIMSNATQREGFANHHSETGDCKSTFMKTKYRTIFLLWRLHNGDGDRRIFKYSGIYLTNHTHTHSWGWR
jgi:hypothetical protein